MEWVSSVFPHYTKEAWEEDLGFSIDEVQWDNILNLCARHGLIQCRILHRIHYSNHRLSKIIPNVQDLCNTYGQSPANLVHIFWSCLKLSNYWSRIFDTLQKAYNIAITPSPLSAIFGAPTN